jgi:hypothetical protein
VHALTILSMDRQSTAPAKKRAGAFVYFGDKKAGTKPSNAKISYPA